MLKFINWRGIQKELPEERAREAFRQLATAHIEVSSKVNGAERHFVETSKNLLADLLWSTVIRLGNEGADLIEALRHDLAGLQKQSAAGLERLRQEGKLPPFAASVLMSAGERERESYLSLCSRFLENGIGGNRSLSCGH